MTHSRTAHRSLSPDDAMALYQQFLETPTAEGKVPFVKVAIQCMKKTPRSKDNNPLDIVNARIIGYTYLEVKAERRANSCSIFCSQYGISKNKAADWSKLASEWNRLNEHYLAGACLAELIAIAKAPATQNSPQHLLKASLAQCLLAEEKDQTQPVMKAHPREREPRDEADDYLDMLREKANRY